MPFPLAITYIPVRSKKSARNTSAATPRLQAGNTLRNRAASPCQGSGTRSPHALNLLPDRYLVASSTTSMPHTARSTPCPLGLVYGTPLA